MCWYYFLFFFFKQKTAYEMRIGDWSSDVCSSDLHVAARDLRNRADRIEPDRRTGAGIPDEPRSRRCHRCRTQRKHESGAANRSATELRLVTRHRLNHPRSPRPAQSTMHLNRRYASEYDGKGAGILAPSLW